MLDLYFTLTKFANLRRESDFSENCYTIAMVQFARLQEMFLKPGWSMMELEVLRPRLERIRLALENTQATGSPTLNQPVMLAKIAHRRTIRPMSANRSHSKSASQSAKLRFEGHRRRSQHKRSCFDLAHQRQNSGVSSLPSHGQTGDTRNCSVGPVRPKQRHFAE